MSPITSVKQTGLPTRRTRKRQRRRGVQSTEEKASRGSGLEGLGKEGIDMPGMRATPQDLFPTSNYYASLLEPATNAVPKASSMRKEPKTGPACAPKQHNSNNIVLAPPQSAFTFSCSRPASTTANVRSYAGSQKHTPVRVSAAGSPLPKVATSLPELLGELPVRNQESADKTVSRIQTIKPKVQPRTYVEVPLLNPRPAVSMVSRDLALAHTSVADEVPGGWPMPEPLIMAPSTKDRKSRFLPALSKMAIRNSESSTGGNTATTGTILPEIVTSPVYYTDALEHQIPDAVVASKHASSHGSTDSGYGTKSGSPSIEVSPTWNHSPSSEHEWEGRDVGFWMRE